MSSADLASSFYFLHQILLFGWDHPSAPVCPNVSSSRAAAVKDALARPLALVLDGREHDDTLITAGVRVLSEVGASFLCPEWVPHRAQRGPRTPVSRLIEVTSTAVPAGTGADRSVAGSVETQNLVQIFTGFPQSNSVPSVQMQCRMIASLRAMATLAFFRPTRLASRCPQF